MITNLAVYEIVDRLWSKLNTVKAELETFPDPYLGKVTLKGLTGYEAEDFNISHRTANLRISINGQIRDIGLNKLIYKVVSAYYDGTDLTIYVNFTIGHTPGPAVVDKRKNVETV